MPKNLQYNWEQLKIDYLQSDHKTVKAFLTERYGEEMAKNGNTTRKTTGWNFAKDKFLSNILKKAKALAIKKAGKDLEVSAIQKMAAKKAIMGVIFQLLNQQPLYEAKMIKQPNGKKKKIYVVLKDKDGNIRYSMPKVTPAEIRNLYAIIKTELGEPSTISDSRLSGDGLGAAGGVVPIFYLPDNGRG